VVTPVYVLVRLWIREGLEAEFEAYERKVCRIMARYGGVIERTIRPARTVSQESGPPFEIHVLRFQSQALYEAYRADSERAALSEERVATITHSEALVGIAGPTYGP
jgi:antibiotic biosynthesis monooxygenase (ABM) superfamily enzyme